MKTPLLYGFGMALAGFVITLLMFAIGFHTPERFLLGMIVGGLAAIAVMVVGLVLGIRAVRKEKGPGRFTYGQGLVAGLTISLFSTVFGIAFQQLYARVINPHFNESIIEWTQGMLEKAEMPSEEIEAKVAEAREKSGLVPQIRSGLIGGMIFGLILSLIIAIFFRRAGENADAPAPA
jgi:hypothetical protein